MILDMNNRILEMTDGFEWIQRTGQLTMDMRVCVAALSVPLYTTHIYTYISVCAVVHVCAGVCLCACVC